MLVQQVEVQMLLMYFSCCLKYYTGLIKIYAFLQTCFINCSFQLLGNIDGIWHLPIKTRADGEHSVCFGFFLIKETIILIHHVKLFCKYWEIVVPFLFLVSDFT